MKIVADDAIPFLRGVLEPHADVVYLPGSAISREDLLDADALIVRTRTKCSAKLLADTKVRFVATATIGCDHIDAAALAQLGIRWVSAPGCNAASVAQYLLSLLFRESAHSGISLEGKTLGIVGAGHVGTKVAAHAAALGMRVLLNDPPRARKENPALFVSLDTILHESDYISIHTPLNMDLPDRTFHLANEEFFLKAARKPFFINAARGSVTDQHALKSALITGKIRGAALDVWEDEPDINIELMNMLFCATPHIAGYSADGKANGTAAAVRALAEFFSIPGFENFFPAEVPQPENPQLVLSDPKNAVRDAVLTTYDVLRDDSILRADPESFEAQRAHYPLRREFPAYTILSRNKLPQSTAGILSALGFRFQN